MYNTITSLFTLYLISQVTSNCGPGTLSCSKSSGTAKPVVCDFFNSYILDTKNLTCNLRIVSNCEVAALPNTSHSCYLCQKGFVLDKETSKCTAVQSQSIKENCERYSNQSLSCVKCKSDFFLSAGTCGSIGDNKIESCEIYKSSTECLQCKSGNVLKEGKCKPFTPIANCYLHREVDCDRCQDQYFLNPSANPSYNESSFVFGTFDFSFLVLRNPKFTYWTSEFSSQICQQGTIKNCRIYDSFSICRECSEGHYINTAKQCDRQQEEPIFGCDEYESSKVCSKCQFKFYLDKGSGTCLPVTEVDSCTEYHISENKCVLCEQRYYLSASFNCFNERVDSLNMKNCDKRSPNKDECEKCINGYSLSTNNKHCFGDIKDCKSQIQSSGATSYHTCSQCEVGFHPNEEKNMCTKTSIMRCLEYSLNQNICNKCEEGYYFDQLNKVCARQSRPSCSEFSPMTNSCLKCDNLHFLINNTCTSIQLSQFCFESNGKDNTCEKCLPQYLKEGTTCNASIIRNSLVIDSNCASNQDTEITSNCTDCGTSHFILNGTLSAKTESFLTDHHCFKVNQQTGQCAQCVENSNGVDNKCEEPKTDLTTDCLQLKEGEFSTLGNSNCAKCRDPMKHYLDTTSHICRNRLHISTSNCEELPDTDSACLTCKPNFYPQRNDSYYDQCFRISDITGFAAITDCVVYDIINLSCLYCRDDFKLSPDKKTCIPNTSSVAVYFNYNMELINQPLEPEQVLNCAKYYQFDLGVIKCAECNPNYVGIVSIPPPGTKIKYNFEALGQKIGLSGVSLPIEKCEPYTNSFQKEIGGAGIISDTCGIGVMVEKVEGYACLKCKPGFNGVLKILTKDRLGKALPQSMVGVTNCEPETVLKSDFFGLGYQHRFLDDFIPYATYINFTNCTDTNQRVIFNSIMKSDGTLELKEIKSSNGVQKIMYCATLSSISTPFINIVPNCQIFAFRSQPPENHNPLSPPVDTCLACMPGHKQVLDGNNIITKCEPIQFCIEIPNNKYLNACSKPQNGYKLDTLENNQLIMLHEPIGSFPLNACHILSNDLSSCIMCIYGYSIVDGNCMTAAAGPNSAQFNCNIFGYGFNKMTLHYAVNTNQRLMNYHAYLSIYNINFIHRKTLCSQCDSGFVVGVDVNKTASVCSPIASIPQDQLIENCDNYKAANPVFCAKCKSGYIPNIFDGKCVPKSSYSNCLEITGFVEKKCVKCSPGFAVDKKGKCVPNNCKRFLNNKCTLCNDGFKYNDHNELYCEFNLNSLDNCTAYSPVSKTCGKCKNQMVLYLFYENINSEKIYKGFACEIGTLMPLNEPGWKDYNLEEVYIESVMDPDTKVTTNTLMYINNDDLNRRLFENKDPLINPAKQHCFANRQVLNCIPEFLHEGTYCSKCQNGYIIDFETNTCKPGQIPNCDIFKSATECEKCNSTHFLYNNTFCSPYTLNINCKEIHLDKNECKNCEENYFLNNLKHCELRRSDINCKVFEENENKCTSCLENYVLHPSTRTCIKRVAKFCEEVDPNLDKCTKCKPGHWMDSSNQNVCRISTKVEHCSEYDEKKDSCKKCSSDYYAIQEGKKCKHKPDGIIGCEIYSDFGKCSQCKKDHFLSNNQCIVVTTTVDNCIYYQSNGLCSKCDMGYFLNSGTCAQTDISDCAEYYSLTQCKKCIDNYVLKWTDQMLGCHPSQISGCIKAIGGAKNSCLKCEPGKILSADRSSCDSPTIIIPNCQLYKSASQCRECSLGYTRSKDWKTCTKKIQSSSSVGTHCLSEVTTSDIICDLCKPGFKKNDKGDCVSCGGNGCLICGSGFLNCSVCQDSFYMNSDLKCVINANSLAKPKD